MYDTTLGRFLQRDPIGFLAGLSRYEYANDNPFSGTDPLGTYTFKAAATATWHPVGLVIPGWREDKEIATFNWEWEFDCTKEQPSRVQSKGDVRATQTIKNDKGESVNFILASAKDAFSVEQKGSARAQHSQGGSCMLVHISAKVNMYREYTADYSKVKVEVTFGATIMTASLKASFEVCCCCNAQKDTDYSVMSWTKAPEVTDGNLPTQAQILWTATNVSSMGECFQQKRDYRMVSRPGQEAQRIPTRPLPGNKFEEVELTEERKQELMKRPK